MLAVLPELARAEDVAQHCGGGVGQVLAELARTLTGSGHQEYKEC
jgi:hypothetical protein